jgi:hypothetical protein
MRAGETLLDVAKLVAIIVIAAVIGVLAGKGLSKLTRDSVAPASPAARASTLVRPPAAAPAIGVHVTFAGLRSVAATDATTSGGARLRIGVRLRNRSSSPVTLNVPRIRAAGNFVSALVSPDGALDGGVRRTLPAGSSTSGVLRFDTGAVTTGQLTRERVARLVIAGRTISVRLEVAVPAPDVGAGTEPPTDTTATLTP